MSEHVRKRSMTNAEIRTALTGQQRCVVWPIYPLIPGIDVLDRMSVELDESGGAGATGIYKFAEQDGDDPKKVLGYVPSKDDWALLKRRYNALYERRPPWEIIVQDLLLAGHAPSEACKYLVQSPYTVRWLLDEVRKLDAAPPAQDVKAGPAEPPADAAIMEGLRLLLRAKTAAAPPGTAAQGGQAAPAPVEPEPLDALSLVILRKLAQAAAPMIQEKLADAVKRDVKTIAARLEQLRRHGLTRKTGKGRSGEALTAKGRIFVSKLPD